MNKKNSGKRKLAVVSIGACLLTIVVWVATVFASGLHDTVFSSAFGSSFVGLLTAKGQILDTVIAYIILAMGGLAFLGAILLDIFKKKGLYALTALASLLANVFALWTFVVSPSKTSVLFVFAIILFAFAMIGYFFALFFALEKNASSIDEAIALSEQIEAEQEAKEQAEEEGEEEEKQEEEKPAPSVAPEEKATEEVVEEEPAKEEEPVPAPKEEEKKPTKSPKQAKPAAKEETPAQEEAPKEEKKEPKPKKSAKKPSTKPSPKEEEKKPAAKPVAEPKEEEKKPRVMGKYEIYQEAGFYKFRLKANNGEILLVSNSYKTKDGVKNGIETLRKNIPGGNTKILTDKNGFSQFQIFTGNDTRLVAAGEIYPTAAGAQKALASVEKFHATEKVVELDSIPENEVREWKAELEEINPLDNGKIEVFVDGESKKIRARLLASNGQVLFTTATYSSRSALNNGIETIKKQASAGSVSICRDKQNRFQFRVIASSGQVLVMGESYKSKDSAISAANSMRNFLPNAKFVDAKQGE